MNSYAILKNDRYIESIVTTDTPQPGAVLIDFEIPPKPISQSYLVFDIIDRQWVDIRSNELKFQQADKEAKAQRKILLEQSDWTQLADVPLENKSAWQQYRQNLRDITNQPEYPFTITWPIQPT